MQNRRATSLAERGEIAAFRQAALLRMVATDPLVRRGLRHVAAITGGIPGLRDVLDHKAGQGFPPPRALPTGGARRTSPSNTARASAPGASGAAPPTRAQRRLERVVKHQAALAQKNASLPPGVAPVDATDEVPAPDSAETMADA